MGNHPTSTSEQTLFRISWPLFIELALHMGMGIVATLMLSHYSDLAAAGVGVANQLISIFILVFNVTSIASMIIIGQKLGAEDLAHARQTARTAFGMNFWFGLIVSAVVVLFGSVFLSFFDLKGETLAYATTFVKISGASLFLESLSLTLSAILRANGRTKVSMVVAVLMNVLSVIGYVVAIFGLFGMPVTGVVGVSWTIVIARIFAVVVLFYFVSRYLAIRFTGTNLIKLNVKDIKDILVIGVPSAAENLSYQYSQIVITAIVANFGDASLAARVYINNISMLCYLFTLSIAEGTQLLVSRYIGGKQFDRALKRGLRTLKIAMIASFIVSMGFALTGAPILQMFTEDPAILAVGIPILWAVAFTEPGRAMNIVLMSSLKSAGDAKFPAIIGVISMWGIAVLFSYALGVSFGLGLLGVWIAMGIDEWFRGIFAYRRWRSRPWEKKEQAAVPETALT
ncbi:MATE family efflux transporter [Terribacillus sp. 179-K 1B1 HS]|uniref:MATE family efflux transporter n=1 Tax=Terribacillus sp. 179-K 1B1 HS TaxID=3142388 RepID=UPI00399F50E8